MRELAGRLRVVEFGKPASLCAAPMRCELLAVVDALERGRWWGLEEDVTGSGTGTDAGTSSVVGAWVSVVAGGSSG